MKKGLLKTNRLIAGYGLLLGVIFACLTLVTTPVKAASGINQTINFQGRLLNSQGATVPDGYYNIQFKIYQDGDGQSAGDTTGSPAGSLKWTETYINNGGNNGVRVVNGYLSVSLGSISPFGTSIDWNQDTLWLSMNIAGSAAGCTSFGTSPCSADGEMVPMQRFTAAPYALNSGKLGGLSSSQFVQLAQGLQTDASNVTSVAINKTGTGKILDLQSGGTDILTADTSGNTIGIGVTGSTNANSTVHIADSTAGVQTVIIGSTNSTSTTTIQAGSGKVNVNGNLSVSGSITSVGGQLSASATVTQTIRYNTSSATQGATTRLTSNPSGVTVNQNDVVVMDNNFKGTTTTTERDVRVWGVSGATVGPTTSAYEITIYGNTTVNATGTINIGDKLVTSTTAGRVKADNSATKGILGIATTSLAGGTGTVGVFVRPEAGTDTPIFSNAADSTAAFQIQKSAGSDTLLTADTSNNRVKLGNDTGTDTNTTILVLDSAASDPTTNVVNGAQYYNTTSNKFRCYQNGIWTDCISTSIGSVGTYSSTNHYTDGATISGNSLILGSADATHPGLVDSSNQTFAGDKTFTGNTLVNLNSATAFQVQNTSNTKFLTVDTSGNTVNVGVTGATAVNSTIHIADSSAGVQAVTIGSTNSTSATTIQGGSGGITFNGNTIVSSGNNFTVTSGTTSLTGTTNINTSGTANTTIGSTSGGTITIGKTSGSDLALQDAQWNITGAGAATFGSLTSNTDVTFASSSTTSGAIIKNFTTSGNINTFDVVIMSSVPDVRTTTAARDSAVFGVSRTAVASGVPATAAIVTSGNYRVNVDSAAVAVGNQLVTSTTAGKATVDNNATTGIIGIALSSKSAGANGTVDVYIRPVGGQYTPTFISNSTTAFQVQNANANNFLAIDTSGNVVNIGITGSTNVNSTIHIADSSAGVQTVTIGSTSSTSATTIQAGTSGITLDGNTTVAGSHSFSTGSGLVSLNGNVSIATDKTFNQQGAGTFSTGSGDVSLNGNTTVASGKTFTVTDGDTTLGGNASITGSLDVTGSAALKKGADFSASGLTNNADFGDVSLVRLSGASAQTITGIANGRNGYLLTIFNGGTATATLNVNDTNSDFDKRITNGTNSNITIPVGASITLVYDSSGQKWRAAANQNLQSAYGSSSSPQITLNSSLGGLVIQDATSPIGPGADLFTVQSNGGTTKYFNVTSSTVSVNDDLTVTGDITASGTYNTNIFTSTALQFGGASGTVSTSSGDLTIQAAGTNSLFLDTVGAGTVSIANSGAATVSMATNNAAHTINIGTGGTSSAQAITIGSSGAAASSVTINSGSSGGISLNGNTAITGTASATGSVSTGGDVSFNSTAANTGAVTKDFVTGSSVTTGDVVVMTNIPDIRTTTAARDTRVFGVSKSTVSSGGTARVVTSGNATVNVDTAQVDIGNQLVTSTTAGKATVDNNATTGIIGIALSSKVAGANGTVSVYVRPVKGQDNPTFRSSSGVANAFQIQNTNGVNLFNVDTSAGAVNIGITGSTNVNSAIHIADSTAGVQTVTIGSTNSTSTTTLQSGSGGIHLNGSTTVDGSSSFSTGTGLVSLNGDTVVASGKNFTQNGSGNFTTGTGAVALNGATTVKNNSASAFQVQNTSNQSLFVADTSVNQIRIYDGAGGANYALIYYSGSTANYTASGGTVAVGTGAGAINVTAGSGASISITANAASTWRTTAGTLTLQSGTSSDLILSSGSSLISINGSSAVKLGSSAGDPATCTAGAIVYNSTTNKIRGCQGSTLAWTDLGVTTPTLQSVYGSSTGGATPEIKVASTQGGLDVQDMDSGGPTGILFAVRMSNVSGLGTSIFNVNDSSNSVNIGTSVGHSSNPIILVLDNYNNGGADPTGVVGAMYYNGTNGKFRCYDGTWRDCMTGFNEITKTSDQAATQNTTTMQNDNKLFFPMAANTNYVIDAWIPIDDNNINVYGDYTFTVPTGAVLNVSTSSYAGTGGNTTCNIITSGSVCHLSVGNASAVNFIQVRGFVRNGSTSGNLQFQFTQSTAGLFSFPVVKAGAVMSWRTAN